ncbi:metallophosphoesterase [Myroides sp. 1354]|uniref:metallophosphoesterase n=1 Tax=unclassified Myroides TaxID=2642485 RepID=UPI002574A0F3|nr:MULTISPECIES: metallophosphoesterase [unclassified Myroides]MDM1045217.1 metallophosphoesterase [Myroides sp. R163-1]MDM1056099.1 metallophosphoesterase [Myroides sp. 1354]MDM1069228.1 metallophosphoesterase [Myroides sp. 1372]
MKGRLLFVGIFIAYFLANIYLGIRVYPLFATPIWSIQLLYIVLVGFLVVSPILFFAFRKRVSVPKAALLYKVGTGWLMLITYSFLLALLSDLLLLFTGDFIERATNLVVSAPQFQAGFILVGTIGIAIIGNINYYRKKVVRLQLETEKPLDQPLKMVVLSDLHLGHAISRKELKRWVEFINEQEADVVLFAGDVIDNSLLPLTYYKLDELLREIKSKYGVYACLGNHEYLANVEMSLAFLHKANITVLRDEVIEILGGQIQLIGRDDKTNPHRKALQDLVQPNPHVVQIVLDHQPYSLEVAAEQQVDFQFSGHTHRGQVWPFSWITDYLFEQSHGYLKKERTQYYVSSGLGIWGGRYRIGTQSEYVIATLYSKRKNEKVMG